MGVHNKNKQYGFGSVKPREAQVVNQNSEINKVTIIGGVIIGLLIISGASFAFLKSDSDTDLVKGDDFSSEELVLTTDSEAEKANNTASIASSLNFSTNTKVKLALLASPDLFDYKNHPILGCDALVFAQADIPKTPKILNATLELLFNDGFDYGFPPANFISSTQGNLDFDSAVIENGVAKVFLTGEMTIQDTSCDSQRIGHQIRETAKQFPTVKSVEIFLNGQKIEL